MGLVRIALAVAALAAVTACSGPVKAAPASYYLALGDSLSQGVQPDMAGANVETRQGYPDQLYAALRSGHPGLQLVKFGCPGETTSTMINGGICGYPGGSQLAAAAAFLRAHRGHVFLLTIDIGANDPEDCGSWASLSTIASCFGTGVPRAATNLATIITRLRAAGRSQAVSLDVPDRRVGEAAELTASMQPGDYIDAGWREIAALIPTLARGWCGILRGDKLEAFYRGHFGDLTLAQLRTPTYAPIWNVERNRLDFVGPRTYPDLPVARAIRMAVSLPLFVQPVVLDGLSWCDGGIVDIFPVRPVLDIEPAVDTAVAVNGFYPHEFGGEDITGWDDRPLSIVSAASQVRTSRPASALTAGDLMMGVRYPSILPAHTGMRLRGAHRLSASQRGGAGQALLMSIFFEHPVKAAEDIGCFPARLASGQTWHGPHLLAAGQCRDPGCGQGLWSRFRDRSRHPGASRHG